MNFGTNWMLYSVIALAAVALAGVIFQFTSKD
jgi:hypothetical protein